MGTKELTIRYHVWTEKITIDNGITTLTIPFKKNYAEIISKIKHYVESERPKVEKQEARILPSDIWE
jgi:hypothetical protein